MLAACRPCARDGVNAPWVGACMGSSARHEIGICSIKALLWSCGQSKCLCRCRRCTPWDRYEQAMAMDSAFFLIFGVVAHMTLCPTTKYTTDTVNNIDPDQLEGACTAFNCRSLVVNTDVFRTFMQTAPPSWIVALNLLRLRVVVGWFQGRRR